MQVIKAQQDRFSLSQVFRIARGQRDSAQVITVNVEKNGVAGRGEGLPYARYGETPALVLAQIRALPNDIALEGLSQLMRTIASVQGGLNRQLAMQGIVLTMYDGRNKLSEQVANDVRTHLGNLVYNTVIPRNVRISEAPSFGQPVLIYDLNCAGSKAYIALAAELLEQEKEAA